MNDYIEIKKMLDRYYEGETPDAEEQRLREYFTSGDVADALLPYRSIFAYLKHEREQPLASADAADLTQLFKNQPSKFKNQKMWWYAAAAAVACLLVATFFVREHQPARQALCTGTYVMVNGICYDDLSLVRKYAAEAIDMVTQPFGDGSATDALDFLE